MLGKIELDKLQDISPLILVISPLELVKEIINKVSDIYESVVIVTTSKEEPLSMKGEIYLSAEKALVYEKNSNATLFVISPELFETNLNSGIEYEYRYDKYIFSVYPILFYLKLRPTLLLPNLESENWEVFRPDLSGIEVSNLIFESLLSNMFALQKLFYQTKLSQCKKINVVKRHLVKLARLEALIVLKAKKSQNELKALNQINRYKVIVSRHGGL